jgi:hypothetical protein
MVRSSQNVVRSSQGVDADVSLSLLVSTIAQTTGMLVC